MCGIVGYFGCPVDDGLVRKAVRAMGHRGPDGSGFLQVREDQQDCQIQMGHARLSIQDLSNNGNQPMVSPSGRYTIVFNGEIYNFKDFRDQLKSPFPYRSGTDTEVILHGLDLYGWKILSELEGMFGFAVWDRVDNVAVCVRDRLGEKPLYYYEKNRSLLVTSEVRAALATGLVERRLSFDGASSLLQFGSVCHPFTMIEGIMSVGAGEVLRYDLMRRRLDSSPYWVVPSCVSYEEDVAVQVERLGESFRRACRLTTVSDTPVAVLSSGGIDSSCNVIAISQYSEGSITTFHARLHDDEDSMRDAECAERLSRELGLPHIETRIDHGQLLCDANAALSAMDQPSIDGFNTYIVTKAIRAAGVKVVVSGQGSDELFLGYNSARRFQRLRLLKRTRLARPLGKILEMTRGCRRGRFDTAMDKLLGILLDDGSFAEYASQHSVFSSIAVDRLLGRLSGRASKYVQKPPEGLSAATTLVRLELMNYLQNTLLRDGDQMSMANSVEMRTPFLNHKFVERAVTFPVRIGRPGTVTQKWPLLESMNPRVPEYIWNKPKRGFLAPFDHIDRNMIVGLFDSSPCSPVSEVNYRRLRSDFLEGQSFFRFFAVAVLNRWCWQNGVTI